LPPLHFPTEEHARVAGIVAEYAAGLLGVDTVLIVNSCARGCAVAMSDLDMAILVVGDLDERALQADWSKYATSEATIRRFCERSAFSAVHLDFFNGVFAQEIWDDGGGPDDFEIEIGNRIAYAAPLNGAGLQFRDLQNQWLPYYDEQLRRARFAMAKDACLYDLDHVPFYVERNLFLQAFDRLYKAFREFLQTLFISEKTYPIAYNKWLKEQLEMIDEIDLLDPLLQVLSIDDLKGRNLILKAYTLRSLAHSLF